MNDSNLLNFLHTNYNLQLQLDIVLGRGGFGDVLGGLYHSKPVAVKVINLRTKQHANSFTAERNALLLPLHPHVTKTLDMLQIGQQYGLVIMERLYQRNLLGYLHDTRYDLDLLTRVRFAWEIASGLLYCHEKALLHLDVKPTNVLLTSDGRCKLGDFGNSKSVTNLVSLQYDFTRLEGTVAYIAPEVFSGEKPTVKSDVYSFGISMWQLLAVDYPYERSPIHTIIYSVVANNMRPKTKDPMWTNILGAKNATQVVTDYVNLYEKCWNPSFVLRPELSMVVHILLVLHQQLNVHTTSVSVTYQ